MLLRLTSTPHLIQHKSSHLYNNHQHICAGLLASILSKRSMMLKLKDNMGEEDDCYTQLSLALGPQKVSAVSGLDADNKRKQELELCLWHSPDLNQAGEDHQDLDKCLNNVNVSRKKLRLTREQTHSLEKSFNEHTTLSQIQKEELAARLALLPRQVEVWFQNRRARTKIKQTEVNCEFLKRCCQSLINENRRLKRELQELRRAHTVPAPMSPRLALCFHLAPAERSTSAVCPSAEEVAVPSSMAMNESMTSEDEKPKLALGPPSDK